MTMNLEVWILSVVTIRSAVVPQTFSCLGCKLECDKTGMQEMAAGVATVSSGLPGDGPDLAADREYVGFYCQTCTKNIKRSRATDDQG